MKHWAFAAFAAALSSSALAQMSMQAHDSTPAAQAAPVMAVPKYESAFDGYRGHADEKIRPWREVNDEAAAIGGHVGQWRGKPVEQLPGAASREAMPMSGGMTHIHGMGDKK